MTDNQEINDVLYGAMEDVADSDMVNKIRNAIAQGHIEFVGRRKEYATDETINLYDWEVTVKLEFTLYGDQENVVLEEFMRENTS
jgi:hypothetical protein